MDKFVAMVVGMFMAESSAWQSFWIGLGLLSGAVAIKWGLVPLMVVLGFGFIVRAFIKGAPFA